MMQYLFELVGLCLINTWIVVLLSHWRTETKKEERAISNSVLFLGAVYLAPLQDLT